MNYAVNIVVGTAVSIFLVKNLSLLGGALSILVSHALLFGICHIPYIFDKEAYRCLEITVVITTYNLEAYIGACLEELFSGTIRTLMLFWLTIVLRIKRSVS